MKKLLIPLMLALLGTGGGAAAAMFLFPAPSAQESHEAAAPGPCGSTEEAGDASHDEPVDHSDVPADGRDYARLNNQFVVPVVEDARVASLVLLSMSIEVVAGAQDEVFKHEPRLRDQFLQVLFDHANAGGFEGNFTSSSTMRTLRAALRTAARDTIGGDVIDVLITDIVRQDAPG